MHFAYPYLLLALLPLWGLFFRQRKRHQKAQDRLSSVIPARHHQRLLKGNPSGKMHKNFLFYTIILTLLLLSLARPQWGVIHQEVEQKGLDIIFALDCSQSMLAKDYEPDRLEVAKRELQFLMEELKGNRMGVIAFSGQAVLFSPLTLDFHAAQMFLNRITTESVGIPGTALGDAIEKAMETFDPASPQAKVLVLLTDGEDHHSQPLEKAKQAFEEGIRIYTIGLGDPEGSRIPDRRGGFLKDLKGETVLTRLDQETLTEIAKATDGKAFFPKHQHSSLAPLAAQIESLKKSSLSSKTNTVYQEYYQWPLALALLLWSLVLGLNIPHRKEKPTDD